MVDAVSSNNAAGRVNAGGQMLASNFQTFLSLLTTQLKNQDPLSPVDSNEFTAQLTQMAGVEQQLLTNDLLTGLLKAQQGDGLTGAAQYIGKDATAVWAATRFEDGEANWSYELAADATDATLQVLDASGKVVWSGPAPEKTNGMHDFKWDGKTTGGGQVDDGGVYTLKVVAKDGAGKAVDSQVLIRGRVTGVEMYDNTPFVIIGNSIMPVSSLIALEEQKAAAKPEDDAGAASALASKLNPFNLLS
ncbi:Basal-body rod modification protein flgD [Brevundimonas diminuta]|jgi:flagellar basal-body rod modification protein FlgD|uniref:Basal-body rod modification protein FlgD n=2 Tax=Brevundimonas TaxID=41275 RepID=A0A246KKL1_BREDI|nr:MULTISPECIES: flagellar hook capping FlgD N-terminal domain-containing protein [Brevundimonas]ASD25936.1 flagellar hook capping protein [Brevundimonas diminuta]EGF95199.1 flagellar hook capping family protein [Brevundimonas diminuta ATCC 11568]MBD3573205.1 flagellar hook capping protein [Brevundimonas diminuta]MBI2248683.1 flagellar hook capping protein [Brevundimonas diminuta]OMG58424.1 flagellar hook capping protein [Brevundimonas sp. ZS04]